VTSYPRRRQVGDRCCDAAAAVRGPQVPGPVRAMLVIVRDVLVQDRPQVPRPGDRIRPVASDRAVRTLYLYCTASKLIAWRLTCGSYDQLCRLVVLADHATEHLAPLDRQVQRYAGLVVSVGWSFLAGLVRAVPVVMAGIFAQD